MTAPGVCLVLTGPRLKDCLKQLEESRPHIDLAELRADLLDRAEWEGLNGFSRRAGLPLILTLRQPRDGGKFTGSAEERLAFFRTALEGDWTWFDLEDDQRLPDLEAEWLKRGRKLVVSFHEFEGLSDGWSRRLLAAQGPGITAKAAVFPRTSSEFLKFVADVQALPPRAAEGEGYVALAMGGVGFPSRVLAARLGSRWTYASSPGQTAAPGQTDPATLQNLYRFREQTAQTPVFGIVGNPVFHTKSPVIHNPGFAALGLPGTYLPFLADDLTDFFALCDRLGVTGLSCTIPFKEDVLLHLDERSPAVMATGACNTLWREGNGPWKGDNTDAPGFMAPLSELVGPDRFEGLRATVVGTGGAARGIVWALREAGAKVVVLGRSPDKAHSLALEFDVEWAPLGPESRLIVEDHDDLIVQTTSVGMGETAGQDPLDWYDFTGREIAYDIIYSPRWTRFLDRAKKAGCRILFGEDMLVGQAMGQFRRFTGREYPKNLLKL
jgi:3-dehydroquinate dehydratase/shikimate dehydrogenase